ncbi:MAG: zf-HC2 domain-containing protein [Armatimonadota bacterium]
MPWAEKFEKCSSVGPRLWEYAAGTLQASAADAARIEAHLVRCSKCRVRLEEFRRASAALALYAAAPETGIPPRAPDWQSVHTRLEQADPRKTTAAAGVSRLRAMRSHPAFALSALGFGLCTTLFAASIPLALGLHNKELQVQNDRGGAIVSEEASYTPSAKPKAPVEMEVGSMFGSSQGFAVTGRAGSLHTCPLVAYVTNNTGKAVTGRISIVDAGALSSRRYEREIQLDAGSEPQAVLLYPSVSGSYSARQQLIVTLRGPFPSQEETRSYSYSDGMIRMALIGDAGYGRLLPKKQVIEDYRKVKQEQDRVAGFVKRQYLQYSGSFARPETAPDRVIGYDGITTLVLSEGAERLNPAQRSALRQWVIGGGSVILLPEADLDLLGLAADTPFTEMTSAAPASPLIPSGTPLRRYTLGMGAVLTVPIDLTQDRFRDRWELAYTWDDLRTRARPMANDIAHLPSAWQTPSRYGFYANDPFRLGLPPLTTVVYLFTGYFLLAIPVTFVILKRTRRMNWAWATGPTLAFLFGGAVYGFTADLHKSKLSRRTGGLLISTAGEKTARFVGLSEIFFPTAGSYDVSIPYAETTELGGDGPATYGDRGNGINLRSLETVDNGMAVSVPRLSVPNLAFRRLRHSQTVPWGDGITADLRLTDDGKAVGTIRNETGRTLENAYILLPGLVKKTDRQYVYNTATAHKHDLIYRSYTRTYNRVVKVDRIAPGITKFSRYTDYRNRMSVRESYPGFGAPPGIASPQSAGFYLERVPVPVLIAQTSGETLGPTIGRYVGSPYAVTVAVTLPPLRTAPKATTIVNGGTK